MVHVTIHRVNARAPLDSRGPRRLPSGRLQWL